MSTSPSPEIPTPVPAPATRMGRARRLLILALSAVVILTLAGTAGAFLVAPRLCGLTEPERHGLSCDIPLPAGARFTNRVDLPESPDIPTEAWAFTVPDEQVHAVAELYSQRLPDAGWRCVKARVLADLPQNGQEQVVALNGNRGLSVTVTHSPPDNVLHLLIAVSTFPQAAQGTC